MIPVTEFAEWTPDLYDVGGGKPIKGEMWFDVPDQPVFAIAGFWQAIGEVKNFAKVTCEPNELAAPIHPKALVTILAPGTTSVGCAAATKTRWHSSGHSRRAA